MSRGNDFVSSSKLKISSCSQNEIYKYAIIDTNNLYYRNLLGRDYRSIYYKGCSISLSGITGSIDSIEFLKRTYLAEDAIIIFVFDNPTSVTRLRQRFIDPEYKNNRDTLPDEMKIGLNCLFDILSGYSDNFKIVFGESLEADDLVKPLVDHIGKDESILLVSNDMDWARSITDTVHWLTQKETLSKADFITKFGFSPEGNGVQLYKAFRGDTVDNIHTPFYDADLRIHWKLTEKLLLQIIAEATDISDLFNNMNTDRFNFIPDVWKDRFNQVKDKLVNNYTLVDFMIEDDFFIEDRIIDCNFSQNSLQMYSELLNYKFLQGTINDEGDVEVFKDFETELIVGG